MLVFPNCKINLGLNITGKREDGYHNIETIFYPVPLNDALEIIHLTGSAHTTDIVFTQSGALIDGEEKDNLCIKSYHLLKKDFPQLPAINIHLHKAIPIGAGLGGGSADAAYTLVALNEKYGLNLSDKQLLAYALLLGSDCPFFIINTPCIATGRGEILQPLHVSLSGYKLVLVNPGIQISTRWAFTQLDITHDRFASKAAVDKSLHTTILQQVSYWKDRLINDFEVPVFKKYPAIKNIKDDLYHKGALFAAMSGSGSSVYGIFDKKNNPRFNYPENYLLYNILL